MDSIVHGVSASAAASRLIRQLIGNNAHPSNESELYCQHSFFAPEMESWANSNLSHRFACCRVFIQVGFNFRSIRRERILGCRLQYIKHTQKVFGRHQGLDVVDCRKDEASAPAEDSHVFPYTKPVQSDCFFVGDFEFRSRAAQALAPRVVICLFFGICYLKFQ